MTVRFGTAIRGVVDSKRSADGVVMLSLSLGTSPRRNQMASRVRLLAQDNIRVSNVL